MENHGQDLIFLKRIHIRTNRKRARLLDYKNFTVLAKMMVLALPLFFARAFSYYDECSRRHQKKD